MKSEDRALKNILQGKPVEPKVMVGYEGEKKKVEDKESHLTKIMSKVRMPWFCPKCDKVMKKRLDNKMWRLFDHCFDCQVELEHELRISGQYDEWEHRKTIKNKISLIKNDIEELQQWKDFEMTVVEPVNIDTGFVQTEKYETPKKLLDDADEAIKQLQTKLQEFEMYLEGNFVGQ
tara:strand:- start:1632 stop:2159 length:528 start_codon:yes stop_codon:yes gene_type:complete